MRAGIKSLYYEDRFPEDSRNFGTVARILACPRGQSGEESFDVTICTPAWLSDKVDADGPLIGRHYLVVKNWDENAITKFLSDWVDRQEAPTWAELGERLARLGSWEFEDYQP